MYSSSVKWNSEGSDQTKAQPTNLPHETALDEAERIEQLFKNLDLDGNGKIDIHDLSVTLKGAGVHPDYAKVCFLSVKATHAFFKLSTFSLTFS